MSNNHRGNRLRPPPSPIAARPQGPPHISQTDIISSQTNELTGHRNFVRYSHIIHGLLEAHEDELSWLRNIRDGPPLPLFQEFFPNLYSTPPPDIFYLVLQIRDNKSWDAMKEEIIMQVNNARPLPAPSWTNPQRHPGRACLIRASLPPHRRPRDGLLHSSSGAQQNHSGFVPQRPGPGAGSSCAAGSPTSAGGHSSLPYSYRTAPPGQLFYCPSKNCRRTFTRQGHYENHLEKCHAEIPPHDATKSLRRVLSSEQTSSDDTGGQDAAGAARGAARPTTPQQTLATSMPHVSISPSPMQQLGPPPAPNADTVGSDTLQSGTSPQISLPRKRPLDTDPLLSSFPYFDRTSYWSFPTSEQTFLETSPSQILPNPYPPFFSPGSHMGS